MLWTENPGVGGSIPPLPIFYWLFPLCVEGCPEAELATGLRMPKASDTRIASTGVADLRGSDAIASAGYSAIPEKTINTHVGAIIILLLFVGGVGWLSHHFVSRAFDSLERSVVRDSSDLISMEEFLSLKLGDSVKDAIQKIGSDKSEIIAQSDGLTMLSVKNRNYSNAILTFQNGGLTSKAQFGLR